MGVCGNVCCVAGVGEVMYFWSVCFRDELCFLNCDDICMCVVNKQFELLKFVFDAVYVDLQYDEISLNKTGVSPGGVLSPTLFNIYTADLPPPRAPG